MKSANGILWMQVFYLWGRLREELAGDSEMKGAVDSYINILRPADINRMRGYLGSAVEPWWLQLYLLLKSTYKSYAILLL